MCVTDGAGIELSTPGSDVDIQSIDRTLGSMHLNTPKSMRKHTVRR